MCRKVSKKGRTGQKRKKSYNTRNSDGVTWLRKILWLMYNVKYALMKDGGFITWKLRIPQIYSSVMVIIKILTIFSTTNVQYPIQLPATHSSIQSFFFFFALNVYPSFRCFCCTFVFAGLEETLGNSWEDVSCKNYTKLLDQRECWILILYMFSKRSYLSQFLVIFVSFLFRSFRTRKLGLENSICYSAIYFWCYYSSIR